MRKKVINILISVIITLLLLRAVKGVWSSGDISAGFENMSLTGLAFAVVCYVLTYPLRSFRIFYMMRKNEGVTFLKVIPVCFRHQFYGRIVPFKAGELSLVYLLKRKFGASAVEGGTVLLFLRFFDAVVIVLSFIICNFFVGMGGWLSYIAAGLLIAIVVFGVAAVVAFPKIIRFLKKHGRDKAASSAEEVFRMLKGVSASDFAVILVTTVILWFFVYLSMHFVAAEFFEGLTFSGTVAASFLASAAAYLPVNGLGGFGTTEAGWTLGFSLIGMNREDALVSGVLSNLMSFSVVCVFGLISFLMRGDKNVQNYNNK